MKEFDEKILADLNEEVEAIAYHIIPSHMTDTGVLIICDPNPDRINKVIVLSGQEDVPSFAFRKEGNDEIGNGWILCEDQLPISREKVLICPADDVIPNTIEIATFYRYANGTPSERFESQEETYYIEDVVAWQPLPKPYQPKE